MPTDNKRTFYFHDYETFGATPAQDRPSQFAGVRTDEDFNIISDPLVIYCQPPNDYLPHPEAVFITGITPQEAFQKGLVEPEFARQIHHAFSQPNTCILGYNNIRFDDEVSRYLFYRNFYDPYGYSWQHGNSRWDLLDVVRACYALRPEGVNWPINDQGLPSFKLEHLTKANGIEHSHAHDAMSDVYATIAIAKLLKTAQPKLFDYLLNLRHKREVIKLIDVANLTPLVHVSGMLGAYRGNTSWVVPLEWHPGQPNAVIVCDLAGDITPLIEEDVDSLKARLYTKTSDLLPDQSRLPIKLVHTNKCPVLAPAKTLLPETAERLHIDRDFCLANLQRIRQHHSVIREKMIALFSSSDFVGSTDVDCQLYQGFFGKNDAAVMELVRNTPQEHLKTLSPNFSDPRLTALFFRYRARNYPETLTESEQYQWLHYRQEKLSESVVMSYIAQLNDYAEQYHNDPAKLALIKQLAQYCQHLAS